MHFVEKPIILRDEELVLNNLRAIYWKKENSLIVSDLHIGKSAHFRKHGIAVSSDVQEKDLKRLSILVHHYKPKKIIVVGDLFHAEINTDMDAFKVWRDSFQNLEIILIKGNHDRLKAEVYDSFDIECCQKELFLKPFTLIHEPTRSKDKFMISGHIHPGVLVRSKGRPGLRLPCFKITSNQLILPAFSAFTGLATSKTGKGKKFHAFTETAFFEF
ncbi:MAG: ligase-associated DNA damage response endonuclease PdeM [Bacteroidota bacterium]